MALTLNYKPMENFFICFHGSIFSGGIYELILKSICGFGNHSGIGNH